MPRTRSLAWSELKIGVLAIAALAITITVILLLTGDRGYFWERYYLKVRFPNVAGLTPGSPVRLAGVDIGTVTDRQFAGDRADLVDVTLEINEEARPRITSQSIAQLGSISLLGGAAVDITPSLDGTPIPEWGYVPTGPPPVQLADMTQQAKEGLEEITNLVRDMRQGRGTVGRLMTDDQLYSEMQRFVATAGEVTRGIQQGRGTIGRLLNDPKTADVLEASLQNLETMTRRINAGEGSLGKLMNDDSFSRSLTATTTNLETLTARLNKGEGTAGKLITDATLFNRLNSMSDRLDQMLNNLNAGQGTAGQLLQDKKLYENMNGAVSDLRTLVADIRKDPKKFLNVRVSIF